MGHSAPKIIDRSSVHHCAVIARMAGAEGELE
jgi:hypothetical protein